jgi:uncharacterized protein
MNIWQKALWFLFSPLRESTLPLVPWTPKDGLKMVFFSSLVLLFLSYGGFALAIVLFGELQSSFFVLEHISLLVIFGLFFQVFFQILFLYWFSYKKYGTTWANFGFRKVSWKMIAFLVLLLSVIAIIVQQSYFFGLELLGVAPISQGGVVEIFQEQWIPTWLLFFYIVLLAPVLEELVFRGFLIPAFLKNMSPFWAIAFSAFLFSVAHLSFSFLPVFFFMGILLGLSYVRTKSLLPGICYHIVNNGIAFLLLTFGIGI